MSFCVWVPGGSPGGGWGVGEGERVESRALGFGDCGGDGLVDCGVIGAALSWCGVSGLGMIWEGSVDF